MKNFVALVVLLLVFTTCKKNSSTTPPPTPPPPPVPVLASLTTVIDATTITRNSAKSGGNVTSDGGASVTVRGICFNTTPNPTISNNTIISGSGTGIFSCDLINLTPNTTYYVRAYATNSIGTAYGNEISFSTQAITAPSVTTSPTVSTTNTFSTTANGYVLDDGGTPVTARGTCWSISQTPTIADMKTIDGTGLGSFNSSINNLTANTTYYLRAYATNNQGTSYGQIIIIVVDIEGNIYNTVKIGSQTWMLENLRVGKLNDGTIIPFVISNTVWGFTGPNTPMYCWYNNDITNKNPYGGIYNWFCVGTGLLSPIGWHVPSKTELNLLIHILDPLAKDTTIVYPGGSYVYTSSNIAGGSLKEQGVAHWQSPNAGATNSSGFTGLPGGWRQSIGGDFAYFGTNAGFWTSTPFGTYGYFDYLLSYNGAFISTISDGEKQGFSVRCIKD